MLPHSPLSLEPQGGKGCPLMEGWAAKRRAWGRRVVKAAPPHHPKGGGTAVDEASQSIVERAKASWWGGWMGGVKPVQVESKKVEWVHVERSRGEVDWGVEDEGPASPSPTPPSTTRTQFAHVSHPCLHLDTPTFPDTAPPFIAGGFKKEFPGTGSSTPAPPKAEKTPHPCPVPVS